MPEDASLAAVDDCWNRIGIHGDKRCELLAAHVHCRNCPVYARTAKELLDRFPPSLAVVPPADDDAAQTAHHTLALLVFRVQGEWLGLPTRVLDEVAEMRPVHTVPHHWSPALLGMTNVRGTLTVCVSLAALLGIDMQRTPDARLRQGAPRMLVMAGAHTTGRPVVLPVDEVDAIYRIDEAALQALPDTLSHASVKCARGMVRCGPRTVGLLDAALLAQAIDRSLA